MKDQSFVDLAETMRRHFSADDLDVLQERLRPYMADQDPMATLHAAVLWAMDLNERRDHH